MEDYVHPHFNRGVGVFCEKVLANSTKMCYTYGKMISRTGTSTIIFLYNGRDGVVADDNGLYYMRARYYSPEMRRFVNADIVPGQISNAVTLNRFAYANGNPVSFVDPFGLSVDVRGGEKLSQNVTDNQIIPEIYTYNYSYPSGCTTIEDSGRVFFYKNVSSKFFEDENNYPEGYDPQKDLLIGDFTNQNNPTLYAYQAHKINNNAHDEIVDIMLKYDETHNTDWERTKESLLIEWREHNRYSWASARAQNVDFDNNEEGKGFWYFLEKAIDAALN